MGAAAEAREDLRCCGNCMHTEPVHGSEQFRLMCANRSGYRGFWYLVDTDDVCARFKQALNFNSSLHFGRDDMDGARAIPLTQGKFALVDEADYPNLIRHSWCVTKMGGKKRGGVENFYAIRTTKERRSVRMHRAIMGAGRGEVVDHINHNGLDNAAFASS